MRPLELTRSGIVGTVVVFLVAAVCVRLGLWQLDRRAERLERNAAVAVRLAAAPVVLDAPPMDTTGLTFRRASVVGRVDEDGTVVLAGRSLRGQPGVHVYSPVRVGDGAVLVNRGWMPAADAATVDLAPMRRSGEARYEGVLLPFPEARVEPDRGPAFRRTWFRLDGDALRAQAAYPTPPFYLLATAGPEAGAEAGADGADIAHPVRLSPPALDAGPHLSYAIQWFSFATIFVLGWAALLLTRGGARSPDAGAAAAAGTTDPPGPYHS